MSSLRDLAETAANHREKAEAVLPHPSVVDQQHATAQALLAIEARLGMLAELLARPSGSAR